MKENSMLFQAILPAGLAVVLGVYPAIAMTGEDVAAPPLRRPASQGPQVNRAAMTGVARAGERLVAVGERGIILVSDDQGDRWKQVPVPVSVTLTAVRFVDDRHGWVTGHGGVVLATSDGGTTWDLRLNGLQAARLVLDAAQELVRNPAADEGRAQRALALAKQMVGDGADKPFLDLHFIDAKRGLVVGAYGLLFITEDGGMTWISALDRIDNPEGLHLNAIAGCGPHIVIAGEQGLVLRSSDGGRHFVQNRTPKRSSWFAVAVSADGATWLGGLRGNAFMSAARGEEWTRVHIPTESTITALLRDGNRVLAGDQKGSLFETRDGGLSFGPLAMPSPSQLVSFTQTRDGDFVVAGLQGVRRLSLKRGSP